MTENQEDLIRHQIEEIYIFMDEFDFQRDFFESLVDQFENKGWLSEKQINSLSLIYERMTA